MAGSQLQNIQRGVIFTWGSTLCLIAIMLMIKLIKKRIDLKKRERQEEVNAESAGQKYKEQPKEQESHEATTHQFQAAVVKDTALQDEDTCTQRFMKKMCQLNTNFCPMMMGIVLSIVTGKSYGFQFTIYLISLLCCMCFNVFKVHRACIDFMLTRWAIEIIFPAGCLLMLVGLHITDNTTMLYSITQG